MRKNMYDLYYFFLIWSFDFVLYQKNKIRLAKNAPQYYNYKDKCNRTQEAVFQCQDIQNGAP